MRTSISHPLQVDSFRLASGRVGMTLCPGRKDPSLYGDDWDRDLRLDVDVLKVWGAQVVISLTEEEEMARLRVQDMGSVLRNAGISWLHLPIGDTMAPGEEWHTQWRSASPEIWQTLDAEGRVVIHCKAGLERTALVAALLLCEHGETLDSALEIIARARPNARPLPNQLQWLKRHLDEVDRG